MSRLPLQLYADCQWLHESPPVELIEGTGLTEGALAMLYAAPGIGKTFASTSLSTAVAILPDWLGHRIAANRPVVYAIGEGHSSFPRRLAALRAAHELQEAEPSGVWYVRESFSLLQPDDVTALLDGIRQHLPGEAPALIVIDPLVSFMAGGDENSTRDMSAVVAALYRLRDETKALVWVDHHTGWNADRERGSIVLRGAMDVIYKLQESDGVLKLECEKLRDGTKPEPLHLRLRPVAESCVVELAQAPEFEQVTHLTAKQQHVLDTLRAIVVEEPVPYTRWRDATGTAETTFDRTLALLVRNNYVMKYGKGRGARYAPPGPLPPTPISPPFHPHGGGPVTPMYPHTPIGVGDGGEGDPEGDRVPF